MPRRTGLLFALAYLIPVAGFALATVLPRSGDELGVATAALSIAVGLIVGSLLLLVAFGRSVAAIVRARGRVPASDYALVIGGTLPAVLLAIWVVVIQ